jgi:MFS family permease
LPKIVSDFKALDEVTWVASACACIYAGYQLFMLTVVPDFLTQAGFMLTVGQLLAIAPTKWVYMTSITIFELGSLICGVAPRMEILILGRAIAGVGAAGLANLCFPDKYSHGRL